MRINMTKKTITDTISDNIRNFTTTIRLTVINTTKTNN